MRDWIQAQRADQIAYLSQVVNIPSGTMNAAGVQKVRAVFRASLDCLGSQSRWSSQDSVKRGGHLIAVHKGKAGQARLLLIGHLDTVFEGPGHAWSPDSGDSTAHGAGAQDMKGGDVVLLWAIRALAHAGALKDAVGPNDPAERGAGDISFVAAQVGGSLDGLGQDGSGDHSPAVDFPDGRGARQWATP